jgi:hypothetical protein
VRGPRRCHRSVTSLPAPCVSTQRAPKTFYGRGCAAHASKARSSGGRFRSTDTLSISTAMRRSLSWSSTASSTSGSQTTIRGEPRFSSGLAFGSFASRTMRSATTSTPFSLEFAPNCVCRSIEMRDPLTLPFPRLGALSPSGVGGESVGARRPWEHPSPLPLSRRERGRAPSVAVRRREPEHSLYRR